MTLYFSSQQAPHMATDHRPLSVLRTVSLAASFTLALLWTSPVLGGERYDDDGWTGSRADPPTPKPWCTIHKRTRIYGSDLSVTSWGPQERQIDIRFPTHRFTVDAIVPVLLIVSGKSVAKFQILAQGAILGRLTFRDVYPADLWEQLEVGVSLRVVTSHVEWTFDLDGYRKASAFLRDCVGATGKSHTEPWSEIDLRNAAWGEGGLSFEHGPLAAHPHETHVGRWRPQETLLTSIDARGP